MANAGSGSGDIFDVRKIRRLVELMNEHDLSVIDLKQGDQRIRLRRGGEPAPVAMTAPAMPAVASPAAPSAAAPAAAPAAPADENVKEITSPMVGTFYTAPNPDSAAFVKVGDHVGPESPVCIVEAMKVFNEIPAEVSGQIVAVLVENGEPVEYGQPLFRVNTAS